MKNITQACIGLTAIVVLAGCTMMTAETLGRAAVVHRTFPTLAESVALCTTPYPAAQAEIAPHFNNLIGKWEIARDKAPQELVLETLAARRHLSEIKSNWVAIEDVLEVYGIDCGPAVKGMADNARLVFSDVEKGLAGNERVATWLEIGNMVAAVVIGSDGKPMRRMLVPA